MILRCVLFVLVSFFIQRYDVDGRTFSDDYRDLLKGSGRVVVGAFLGDVGEVRRGVYEGGTVNAIFEPYIGEMLLRIGQSYYDFPSCPALHLAINMATSDHLNVAGYLMKQGADASWFKLPNTSAVDANADLYARGYPPAIAYALGFGQDQLLAHATILRRLHETYPDRVYNATALTHWQQVTGNPPLLHIAVMQELVDVAHVLIRHIGVPVDQKDEQFGGLTALHIASWRNDIQSMVMLLHHASPALALITDYYGRLPLHYAVMRRNEKAADLLLNSMSVLIDEKHKQQRQQQQQQLKGLTADDVESLRRQMLFTRDTHGFNAYELTFQNPKSSVLRQTLDNYLSEKDMQGSYITQLIETIQEEEAATDNEHIHTNPIQRDEVINSLEDIDGEYNLLGGWRYWNIDNGFSSHLMDDVREVGHGGNSLKVDVVDAHALVQRDFKRDYFITQRPTLLTNGPSRDQAIWMHVERENFLRRYGQLKVYVHPQGTMFPSFNTEEVMMTASAGQGSQSSNSKSKTIAIFRRKSKRMLLRDFVNEHMTHNSKNQYSSKQSMQAYSPSASFQKSNKLLHDLPIPSALLCDLCSGNSSLYVSASSAGVRTPPSIPQPYNFDEEDCPKVIDDAHRRLGESYKIFLETRYAGSGLHAHNATWNLLLVGRKKWYLVPPGHAQIVVEKEKALKIKLHQQRKDIKAADELLLWMKHVVPQLRKESVLVEVTQHAGDVLFIPHGWLHATISDTDTVAVAQEFCTLRHSDMRIHPLGAILYGDSDPHRGLGRFKTHHRSKYHVGIDLEKFSKNNVRMT